MNRWIRILCLASAFAFTLLGTYTLIRMNSANDYMFFWTEKVHAIRITEIILGIFSSAYIFTLIAKEFRRELNENYEKDAN